jgi:MFS family permease
MSAVAATERSSPNGNGVDQSTAGNGDLVALRSTAGITLVATTVLASAVGFLDAYVVNVAVPAIGRDLHATTSALQSTLTSYLVTVAALLLLSGALADRFGRRRLLAVGLGVPPQPERSTASSSGSAP